MSERAFRPRNPIFLFSLRLRHILGQDEHLHVRLEGILQILALPLDAKRLAMQGDAHTQLAADGQLRLLRRQLCIHLQPQLLP